MKKKFLVPALAVTVLGGGIAGSVLNISAFATGNAQTEVSQKEEQKQLEKEVKVTKQEGIDIALKEVNGEASHIELENEDGVVIYSVEITDDQGQKHEVAVDANTGKVLKVEADGEESENEDGEENDKEEQKRLEKEAILTKEESIVIALKQVPGKVKDAALEDEDGIVVFAVDVIDEKGHEQEIVVDAKSGEVLKVEADDEEDDEEDDDDDDEMDDDNQ
ncbi:PepSY domain-containing protein [Domibacillus epiphyticus]|uniref:PepSY domain-containing protein n=1 Tax=Domibacillus epiphyticus TaxID=1714355 RepID=A0A1V2ABJ9_9BACI|nr:PepSY domain-containing protein [Domibacillus epiphyticus]OMP68340.1 hypothetical protein BTO28_02415 [Domibacillus epiphyticus]